MNRQERLGKPSGRREGLGLDGGSALEDERAHLRAARLALGRMRAHAEGLDPSMAGSALSSAYLHAALWRRAQVLADDPSTPLFFGRVDYAAAAGSYHVGRRHVHDGHGDPLVVDWRADVARPFYRASAASPDGLALRRRFGFSGGTLTAYEDETFTAGSGDPEQSRILRADIEAPRVGPMRDIVATIQPEQDEIVRADLTRTVCVQGAPGTGKTAVGLHRAAYLLYAHRSALSRQGVLVVGPSAAFLRYIGDVLPALGEIDVVTTTVEELVARVPVRADEPPAIAQLKGDARIAEVLRRAVWSHLREPTEGLVVPRGSVRWRVPASEVGELVDGLVGRGVRYGAGRAMLSQRLAHAVLLRMEAAGTTTDDRLQDAVGRSQPVRALVDALWPALDPARLVARLYTDAALLGRCADGLLDPSGQESLRWRSPPRGVGRAPWTMADAVLVDEVADLLERTPSVGHVVLDEAQDLSPMQLRAVGRRASTGSATVLGDIAQGTTPWASESWADTLAHLGKSDGLVEELTRSFRVPAEVLAFATRLLPHIAASLAPPTAVRVSAAALRVDRVVDPDSTALAAVERALGRPGSVGLVAAASRIPALDAALRARRIPHAVLGEPGDIEARLDLVAAPMAKGLEFDHVVLVEPAEIVAGEPDWRTGLRRLYVCLTRAVTSLAIVHAEPLPSPLR